MSVFFTVGGELALLLVIWALKKRESQDTFRRICVMIMTAYIVGVLCITVGTRSFDPEVEINLIPLKSYFVMVRGVFMNLLKGEWAMAWQQVKWISYPTWSCLVLNILLFLPYGIMMPQIAERLDNTCKLVIAATVFSLIMEIIQLLTKRGWFDVDDIINNALGAWIGIRLQKRFLSDEI